MNRRVTSVLAWLDSICVAAERKKTAEIAFGARMIERRSEDTRSADLRIFRRNEGESFVAISGQDPGLLRDMLAVVPTMLNIHSCYSRI